MFGRIYEPVPPRRLALVALVTAGVALSAAAPAGAAVPHTVQPGDTLWSIAAASNLTTRALAVYNGMAEDADVVLGTTIDVPSEDEAAGALESAGVTPASSDSGDSSGGGSSSGDSSDSGDSSSAGPEATGDQVSSSDIITIAEENGVPGSLAAAIAWQESGFDNGVVSPADARGVMQIIPGTWEFVQTALGAGQLDPSSSQDNIRAGVLYLRYLLDQTGGDPEQAAAAYYQGLGSVQSEGLLPETERYVAKITALRSRFGGP